MAQQVPVVHISVSKAEVVNHVGLLGSDQFVCYHVDLRFQRYSWTLTKRFREVLALHQSLKDHPSYLRVSGLAPTKPLFSWWGSSTDDRTTRDRVVAIARYLSALLNHPELWSHPAVRAFCEVSGASFDATYGRKGKEGFLLKCSGGYHKAYSLSVGDFVPVWKRRWFVLDDCCISYFKDADAKELRGVVEVDGAFKCGPVSGAPCKLFVSNKNRHVVLQCASQREASEWLQAITAKYRLILRNPPAGASVPPRPPQPLTQCPRQCRHTPNRHGSFAPARFPCDVKFYCNGKDAFAAMAHALLRAKDTICIAGWWLTPDLLLTRPPYLPPTRLDRLLLFKAEQGVRVYVILYHEIKLALPNASRKAYAHLSGLHANIQVMRHPNKVIGGSKALLWSHHEKLVVVDHSLAFVGGLDLAVGRWDDDQHRLTDEQGLLWSGPDYYQPNADSHLEIPTEPQRPTSRHGPLPRELLTSTAVLQGQDGPAGSPVSSAASPTDAEGWMEDEEEEVEGEEGSAGSDGCCSRRDTLDSLAAMSCGSSSSCSLLAMQAPLLPREVEDAATSLTAPSAPSGEAQVDAFSALMSEAYPPSASAALSPSADQRLRQRYPRMPWHDLHVCLSGAAARDVGLHFMQRWNHHRLSKAVQDSMHVLRPPVDDPWFGVCASCAAPVHECQSHCTTCGYDVGRPSAAYVGPVPPPTADKPAPPTDQQASLCLLLPDPQPARGTGRALALFVDFEVEFEGALRLRVAGAGPTVVVARLSEAEEPDVGPQDAVPQEGDVLLRVCGRDVSHLAFHLIERLVKLSPRPLTIRFRRYSGLVAPSPPHQALARQLTGIDTAKHPAGLAAAALEHVRWEMDQLRGHAVAAQLLPDGCPLRNTHRPGTCHVQVVRSVGAWSLGVVETEASLLSAYREAILSAEHLIYIESQFFISRGGGATVKNEVSEWVWQRVDMAVQAGEVFRVVLVLPLHPEGDYVHSEATYRVLRCQLDTIKALLGRFSSKYPHLSCADYLSLHCLRRHGKLGGRLVSEQVYVHDKLLIVDDITVIVGSANINDRSLLGDRDSEIAVVVQDEARVESKMAGKCWRASRFALELRLRLWRKHLGDAEEQALELSDPVSDAVYHGIWRATSARNTAAFVSALDGPSAMGDCRTMEHHRQALERLATQPQPPEAESILGQVRGLLHDYPLGFLDEESGRFLSAQSLLVPEVMWC